MGGLIGATLCPPPTLEFRYDRILMIDGEPFFPIGVEFELRNQYHLLDTVGFNCVFLEQDFNYGGILDVYNYGIISVNTDIFENPPNYSNPENLYALADTAQKYDMYIFGDYWPFHRPSYRAFPPGYIVPTMNCRRCPTGTGSYGFRIKEEYGGFLTNDLRMQWTDSLVTWIERNPIASNRIIGYYVDNEPLLGLYSFSECDVCRLVDSIPFWQWYLTYGIQQGWLDSLIDHRMYCRNYLKSLDPNRITVMYDAVASMYSWHHAYDSTGIDSALRFFIRDFRRIAPAYDVIGLDIYPWPDSAKYGGIHILKYEDKMRVYQIGDYTRILVDSVGYGQKPVWMNLAAAVEHSGSEPEALITLKDHRFQAYDAIINGATGLYYYGWWYYFTGNELRKQSVQNLFKFIKKELSSLVYPGLVGEPYPGDLVVTPDTVIKRAPEYMARWNNGYVYLFVVNPDPHHTTYITVSGVQTSDPYIQVLGDLQDSVTYRQDIRTIPVLQGGAFLDSIEPYGARVYRWRTQRMTAYNYNRLLVREPGTEILSLTYTDGSRIYFTTSRDGGNNWGVPQLVGYGIEPAMARLGPYNIAFIWIDKYGNLAYREAENGRLGSTYNLELPHFEELIIEKVNTPSIAAFSVMGVPITPQDPDFAILAKVRFIKSTVRDSFYYGIFYLAYDRDVNPPVLRDWRILDVKSGSITSIEALNIGHPSIEADDFGRVHMAWMNSGEIHYMWYQMEGDTWSSMVVVSDTFPQSQADYPRLGFFGSRGEIAFELNAPGQPKEVYQANNFVTPEIVYPWSFFNNLSQTPYKDSRFPVVGEQGICVWAEEVDGQYDILLKIGDQDPINISNTPTHSLYPHISTRWDENGHLWVYTVWTEVSNNTSILMSDKRWVPVSAPQAYVSASLGEPTPSPYTEQRTDYMSWSTPADRDPSELRYAFDFLDPAYQYRLSLTFYVPGEYLPDNGTPTFEIMADNEVLDTVWVPRDSVYVWQTEIPTTTVDDTLLKVKIHGLNGFPALLSQIALYRYEEVAPRGGPMGEEGTIYHPMSPELRVIPVVGANRFEIHYVIPEGQQARVEVYSVDGRKIETLAERLQGRGMVLWSPKAKHFPTGTYFVRLTSGSITRTVRVIYAR